MALSFLSSKLLENRINDIIEEDKGVYMNKREIIQKITNLDNDLVNKNIQTEANIYITGGSALALLCDNNRITADIDVLACSPEIKKALVYFNMNMYVQTYEDYFPSNYTERATKINIGTKKINCFVLSEEDIAISKMCTTRGGKDIDDVEYLFKRGLNYELMDSLILSMKDSMFSESAYCNLLNTYNYYKEKYERCEEIDRNDRR